MKRVPYFVVSTGRCGSRMIASVLDKHPDISAYHEPKPYLNTEAYLRWSGKRNSEYIHRRLARKRDDFVSSVDEKNRVYVESSHFLSHLIPELRERYGGKFIHLYRDGRYFVRSGLERTWYRDPGLAGNLKTWLRRRTALPIGFSFRDHRLDPPPEMTTRFEKTTWLWTEINSVIMNSLDALPDNDVLEIRLERFSSETIRQVLSFVGRKPNADSYRADARGG